MEMGVFEAIPLDGSPVDATELSKKLNVDKDLLGERHSDLYLWS
jgi:hypothetical protein